MHGSKLTRRGETTFDSHDKSSTHLSFLSSWKDIREDQGNWWERQRSTHTEYLIFFKKVYERRQLPTNSAHKTQSVKETMKSAYRARQVADWLFKIKSERKNIMMIGDEKRRNLPTWQLLQFSSVCDRFCQSRELSFLLLLSFPMITNMKRTEGRRVDTEPTTE